MSNLGHGRGRALARNNVENSAPRKTAPPGAHQLARLVYRLLKFGKEYVNRGTAYYEDKFRATPTPVAH